MGQGVYLTKDLSNFRQLFEDQNFMQGRDSQQELT